MEADFAQVSLLLADRYDPKAEYSPWYCKDPECDGKPHRDWEWNHARAGQRAPSGDWYIWLILSGRGWGKSRTASEWLLQQAKQNENTEWAVIAPTRGDTRKCAEDLNIGLVNLYPDLITNYNKSLGDIYLKNGAIIRLVSADKPDRLRGFNLAGAWCDELASWRYPDTWNLGLLPAIRDKRTKPHIIVTTTPKPVALLREIVEKRQDRGTVRITRGSTFDNEDNLAPEALEELKALYHGTRRGRQELYGELLTDVDGALVTFDMIERTRLDEMPPVRMVRTVVAVDPATTAGENSDETGIVVCAKGQDGRGYVLADYSCKDSPDGWARRVAAAYEEFRADRVVAEKNQGGDMVESVVRSVHPNIAYKGVNAKLGKKLRAEPIAALYEQGKVSHVGNFTKLEDQWTTWIPEAANANSPDRVDALVHGMTELGLVGLPGVHAREWLESMMEICVKCGTPSAKGTTKCPKCGSEIIMSEPREPEKQDEEFSLTSGLGRPEPQQDPKTRDLQDFLQSINPATGWINEPWQRPGF